MIKKIILASSIAIGLSAYFFMKKKNRQVDNKMTENIIDRVVEGVRSVTGSPRGIRNNNPGNIELGDKWLGRVDDDLQKDNRFVQFVDAKYGIRAMTRIIDNYKRRHGVKTIEQIINRWAPSNENNTKAYINSVLKQTGFVAVQIPDKSKGDYLKLIKAIIKHENGIQPYSDLLINEGIGLA